MANFKVIDVPLTREHADIILKALYEYRNHGYVNWDYPGDSKVNEEIEYIQAIIRFYEAAEVLNGRN